MCGQLAWLGGWRSTPPSMTPLLLRALPGSSAMRTARCLRARCRRHSSLPASAALACAAHLLTAMLPTGQPVLLVDRAPEAAARMLRAVQGPLADGPPSTAEPCDRLRGWQRRAAHACDERAFETFFLNLSPASRALLLSQAGPHSP